MADLILDASAVLSILKKEPRAERLLAVVGPSSIPYISAANLAEVVGKLGLEGAPEADIRQALGSIPLNVVPFDASQAYAAGLMRPRTKDLGLSLGDRACLALAESLGAAAVTTDRLMGRADVGVEVRVIR